MYVFLNCVDQVSRDSNKRVKGWGLTPLQYYFSYLMTVSFIGVRKVEYQEKTNDLRHKSLTKVTSSGPRNDHNSNLQLKC